MEIVGLAKHRNVFVEQFPQNSAHKNVLPTYLNTITGATNFNTRRGQHDMSTEEGSGGEGQLHWAGISDVQTNKKQMPKSNSQPEVI